MLGQLDSIDWKKVAPCDSDAKDMPLLIRQLTSKNGDVRKAALSKIASATAEQHTVFEITPHVIPFLFELLEWEGFEERPKVLRELGYYAASTVPFPPEELERMRDDIHYNCRGELVTFPETNRLRETVYSILVENLPRIVAFLTNPEPSTRSASFEALTEFRTHDVVILSLLSEALANETEADAIFEMGRVLYYFNRYLSQDDKIAFLSGLKHAIELPVPTLSKFWIAANVGELSGPNVPDDAIEVLTGVLTDDEPYYQSFRAGDFLFSTLKSLSPERCQQILVKVLPRIRFPEDAHRAALFLLHTTLSEHIRLDNWNYTLLPENYLSKIEDNSTVIFRDYDHKGQEAARRNGRLYAVSKEKLDVRILTEYQKDVIRLILNTDIIWKLNSNLMETHGLPAERDQVRVLLK
jgi:hypothetical protein